MWKEYTELYRIVLNDLDKTQLCGHSSGCHPEPDILKCEVGALGSISTNKTSGGDGIPGELFKNPER